MAPASVDFRRRMTSRHAFRQCDGPPLIASRVAPFSPAGVSSKSSPDRLVLEAGLVYGTGYVASCCPMSVTSRHRRGTAARHGGTARRQSAMPQHATVTCHAMPRHTMVPRNPMPCCSVPRHLILRYATLFTSYLLLDLLPIAILMTIAIVTITTTTLIIIKYPHACADERTRARRKPGPGRCAVRANWRPPTRFCWRP